MRELDILRMVNHERVILLHEVYESKDHVNLVFDFLRAGDLHKRVSKIGAYSELQALSIIRQILEGLSHLHSRGILHRDLKSQNVIIDRQGAAVILDFGLAHPMILDVRTPRLGIHVVPDYHLVRQYSSPRTIRPQSLSFVGGMWIPSPAWTERRDHLRR